MLLLTGTLKLNLNALPSPVKMASSCSLDQLDPSECKVNLFHKRRTKGWWQLYRIDEDGKKMEAVCETFFHFNCTISIMLSRSMENVPSIIMMCPAHRITLIIIILRCTLSLLRSAILFYREEYKWRWKLLVWKKKNFVLLVKAEKNQTQILNWKNPCKDPPAVIESVYITVCL